MGTLSVTSRSADHTALEADLRLLTLIAQLIAQLPDTNPYTLAVGLSALILILVLRRISRRIPGPLIALVLRSFSAR